MIFFETTEAAQEAAATLSGLGGHAYKLLSECVEKQGVKRKAISAAASSLEDAGFVIIRSDDCFVDKDFEILPTLAGEEALDQLDPDQ